MSKKDGILNLVLKNKWFEKIKSGEKTSEYREDKPYWRNLLKKDCCLWDELSNYPDVFDVKEHTNSLDYRRVRFQRGYKRNAETILFWIKRIDIVYGETTDLGCGNAVYEIVLGDRIYG